MRKTDCVVIGAGIAGMTAAIYLKRSNVDCVIVEKSAPGGVMNRTSQIDNYPGYTESDGVNLAMNVYKQITDLEVPYVFGAVSKIELVGNKKIVKTDSEDIETKTIIIASGRVPRELGLEHEKALSGRGISWCAICDGAFYKDKEVAIVGGGNGAFEEAVYLASIASKVYMIYDSKRVRADKILQDKVESLKNVEAVRDNPIKELINENNKLGGLILEDGRKLDVEGLFIFIGYDPLLVCVKELDIERDSNYLVVDKQMRTSVKGIYACGDVIKKDVYQLTTAVGEASIAATFVKKELDMEKV